MSPDVPAAHAADARRDDQVAALVRLRWTMVRGARARVGLSVLLATAVALVFGALAAGLLVELDAESHDKVVLLTPTLLAAFAVLAFSAPLAAGGGNELYPPDQLVAYPVSARTQYLASLLLAPLNLAWFSQVALIVGVAAFLVGDLTPMLPLGLITVLLYVGWLTLLGQALAWLVVGVRVTRAGRRAVWTGTIAIALTAVALVFAVGATTLLDNLPTRLVAIAAAQVGDRPGWVWVEVTAFLAVATVVTWLLGPRTAQWTLRRSGDLGRAEGGHVRRRVNPVSAFRGLLAIDRASVWRSTALRRGVVVLALLPAAVVALAGLPWSSLVLMPGLVAAGAGLLFGVNAFALDASGATWLASQTVPAATVFWAKCRVLVETCVLAVAASLVAGAARAPAAPTPDEAAAALGAAMAAICVVTATSMRLSVRHPHQAELRGARETPAPPGTMAGYSLRLAVSTTLLGLVYSMLATLGTWQASVMLTVAALALGIRQLLAGAREYSEPRIRAHVTATVSAG